MRSMAVCADLLHDRDPLFSAAFSETLAPTGVETVRLPPHSPNLSRRLSPLLALAIPTARGPAANQRGDADPDPSLGGGECGRGRAQDPWGTLEARLRCLRTQRRPVSAPRATPRRSRQPLVGLPRQPPRSDRRLRFLHRPHVDLPPALVLLRHRTPSTHDSAFQRDPRADRRVGGTATAERVSWR